MRATRAVRIVALIGIAWLASVGRSEAQLGRLISPGGLSRPHAALEGLANCLKCHEQGHKVTAARCLSCHEPVAKRMAQHRGVHAEVGDTCVTCHVEHAGVDGQLRPFDTARFDHARVTGFPLDGRHADLAGGCAACHKTRSFLTASPSCASCHADVHKGSLGPNCAACHSAKSDFKTLGGRFDHSKAAFPLVGAHRTVACATCHVNQQFKGLKFATCTACHADPHETRFGGTCTACHTNDTWRTRKVDHDRTAYPLLGRHAAVDCAACHKRPAMRVKPKSDTCAACHVDVHRGTFKQDCKACHSESGFSKAPFDHAKTAFSLTGRHATLACAECHKSVTTATVPVARRVADFRGLTVACASCHKDVHAGELGPACASCHGTSSFRIADYVHPRFPEFFGGLHAPVACDRCHRREGTGRVIAVSTAPAMPKFTTATTRCASCHEDVHLGQEGGQCEQCHSVKVAKFALDGFSHASTGFALTGRHETAPCAVCHKRETAAFPARTGTAMRLKGLPTTCRGCHADVHLGQMAVTCDSCHTTTTFTVKRYVHRSTALVASGFFRGRHAVAACAACHKTTTGRFPGGRGTARQFKVDSRCTACHVDVHRGALGSDCLRCHKP